MERRTEKMREKCTNNRRKTQQITIDSVYTTLSWSIAKIIINIFILLRQYEIKEKLFVMWWSAHRFKSLMGYKVIWMAELVIWCTNIYKKINLVTQAGIRWILIFHFDHLHMMSKGVCETEQKNYNKYQMISKAIFWWIFSFSIDMH